MPTNFSNALVICGCSNCNDLNNKLNNFFPRMPEFRDNHYFIEKLCKKLKFLLHKGTYNKLINNLLKDKNAFKSIVFEISFAYYLESKGYSLKYEQKLLSHNNSSVDFVHREDFSKSIVFELRLLQTQKNIIDEINHQLRQNINFFVASSNEEIRNELVRIQSTLLSKCLDAQGSPIKFPSPNSGYNLVVINFDEDLYGDIELSDCIQVLYGSNHPGVPREWRFHIAGLFQKISPNQLKPKLLKKFDYFRTTIHAVIASRKRSEGLELLDLEYAMFLNPVFDFSDSELTKIINLFPGWY